VAEEPSSELFSVAALYKPPPRLQGERYTKYPRRLMDPWKPHHPFPDRGTALSHPNTNSDRKPNTNSDRKPNTNTGVAFHTEIKTNIQKFPFFFLYKRNYERNQTEN
jgi:hypothetical protein